MTRLIVGKAFPRALAGNAGGLPWALLLFVRGASAGDIRALTSRAFTAAYLALVPQLEHAAGGKVTTAATTMGTGSDSIPSRLARGEAVDIVIVADAVLAELIRDGHV